MQNFHQHMDQLRLHAERKCRKIMTPAAPFNPEVKYWYDGIHSLKLLRNMLIQPNKISATYFGCSNVAQFHLGPSLPALGLQWLWVRRKLQMSSWGFAWAWKWCKNAAGTKNSPGKVDPLKKDRNFVQSKKQTY